MGVAAFTIFMHILLLSQITQSIELDKKRDSIKTIIGAPGTTPAKKTQQYFDLIDQIYSFEYQAMLITYMMYSAWMFTFMHIFEAVFAAKNKREAKYVLFENILDFWILVLGIIYIAVVYKVYRYDTFLKRPDKEEEAKIFFMNWDKSTRIVSDHIFLLIIDITFLLKLLVQLRLLPVFGAVYAIFGMVVKELLDFVLFYILYLLLFAVIGHLLFYDKKTYDTLSHSGLTLFKASAGVFSKEDIFSSNVGTDAGSLFVLIFVIICFILIMNLIVGKLAAAYKKYAKMREVLLLIQTLSVREASEADEKYSAAISAPYPLSILNLFLGTYILSVKKPLHNRIVLHLYFFPMMVLCLSIFIVYELVMLPLCYIKIVAHKIALIMKNPQGAGSKTKSDRLGYALFFLVFGPVILLLNAIVDIIMFIRHTYLTDLDTQAKQKLEDRGYGTTNSIDQRTFKKMLHYFEQKTGSGEQQIALQKDVSADIRKYLNVEKSIRDMIFGFYDAALGGSEAVKNNIDK